MCPFYIEQVVAELRLAPPDQGQPGAAVPETLYEPLLARLRGSPAAVRVAEAAAVIGRHGDRSLLAAVADLDTDQLNRVINELQDARVFEPYGTDGWGFRHELLREVAAELTPPSLRRGLHAKAADALVNGAAGDPDWPLVAAHYEQAARHGDAASAYQCASADARRRGALAEARAYLDRALTQLERYPPGPERDRREIAARLQRGYLAAAAEPEGNLSPVSVADFERCLQLVGTDLCDDQVVATLFAAGAHYMWAADLRRAAQLVDVLRRSADAEQPWLGRANHAWVRGWWRFCAANSRLLAPYFEQATTDMAPQATPHRRVVVRPHRPGGVVVCLPGRRACAAGRSCRCRGAADPGAAAGRAARVSPRTLQPRFRTQIYEIWIRCEAGQLDRARIVAAKMIE